MSDHTIDTLDTTFTQAEDPSDDLGIGADFFARRTARRAATDFFPGADNPCPDDYFSQQSANPVPDLPDPTANGHHTEDSFYLDCGGGAGRSFSTPAESDYFTEGVAALTPTDQFSPFDPYVRVADTYHTRWWRKNSGTWADEPIDQSVTPDLEEDVSTIVYSDKIVNSTRAYLNAIIEGTFVPLHTENYTFLTWHDEYCDVYIDGVLKFSPRGHNFFIGPSPAFAMELEANREYALRIDYWQGQWPESRMHLLWSSTLQGEEPVPASRMTGDPPTPATDFF